MVDPEGDKVTWPVPRCTIRQLNPDVNAGTVIVTALLLVQLIIFPLSIAVNVYVVPDWVFISAPKFVNVVVVPFPEILLVVILLKIANKVAISVN